MVVAGSFLVVRELVVLAMAMVLVEVVGAVSEKGMAEVALVLPQVPEPENHYLDRYGDDEHLDCKRLSGSRPAKADMSL
jgi:hypothetical protein